MTTRVWTREELDRVHPLPDGWSWELHETGPCASRRIEHHSGCMKRVEVKVVKGNMWALLRREDTELGEWVVAPADVALAVILASRGCDSLAEMAGRLEADSRKGAVHDWERGYAAGLAFAAAVVRRGRVNP